MAGETHLRAAGKPSAVCGERAPSSRMERCSTAIELNFHIEEQEDTIIDYLKDYTAQFD